jgi:predicted  nucleic acid-binding Zn-ribbon protein
MHKILQTLVMLQDLDCMIAEVSSKDMKNVEKKMGLKIKGEDQLQEARERLEQSLPPAVLSKYHKLMKRFGRAVVPVVGNNCMGCYVSVPKRLMVREIGNRELRNCERCGMFLYWV